VDAEGGRGVCILAAAERELTEGEAQNKLMKNNNDPFFMFRTLVVSDSPN
jgi:hypothetical protein